MTNVSALLEKLRDDERGLSTVEYVVLLVLIVAMAVAAWNSFGKSVNAKLKGAADDFGTQVQGGTGGGQNQDNPQPPGG